MRSIELVCERVVSAVRFMCCGLQNLSMMVIDGADARKMPRERVCTATLPASHFFDIAFF